MCIHDIHKKRPSDVNIQKKVVTPLCKNPDFLLLVHEVCDNSSCKYVLVPLCTFYDSFIIGFHYLVQTMSLQSNGE